MTKELPKSCKAEPAACVPSTGRGPLQVLPKSKFILNGIHHIAQGYISPKHSSSSSRVWTSRLKAPGETARSPEPGIKADRVGAIRISRGVLCPLRDLTKGMQLLGAPLPSSVSDSLKESSALASWLAPPVQERPSRLGLPPYPPK